MKKIREEVWYNRLSNEYFLIVGTKLWEDDEWFRVCKL